MSKIKEKAKAYDERLAKARKEYSIHEANNAIGIMNALERVFPELRESEDEKIRKAIICGMTALKNQGKETFAAVPINDCIAWLEKQGEQMANPYSGTSFEYNGHTWGMCARDNGVEILVDGHIKGRVFTNDSNAKEMFIKALECVEEQNTKGYKLTDCDKNSWWEDFKAYCGFSEIQKPADKVEPKFEIGDWVVYDHRAYQVVELPKEGYINLGLRRNGKIEFAPSTYCRHWTIQDAKNGDVLACPNDAGDRDVVFIFKNINSDEGWVFCFCASDANGCFCTNNDYVGNSNSTNISPATKEQRDLLFKKMHEAGYEWDAEKKELKKIEQKPAWSEYDEEFLLELSQCCDLNKTQVQWLLSLKDRVQPQPVKTFATNKIE